VTTARPAAAAGVRQVLVLEPLDPGLVRQLSANGRAQSHWPRTNARNRVMRLVLASLRLHEWQPFTVPVAATFRWIVPTRGRRDIDNLASNGIVKAVLDALVKHQYLIDDSYTYVTSVHTELEYQRGRRALEITLEALA
jgi:Holliday junction resolvase RusA-like endonuclease